MDADVIVIGAGMAGLAAARTLAERGVRVVVLEARERVGGRVFSRVVEGGQAVELGAEFVHGRPPELWALIDEAGVETINLKLNAAKALDQPDGAPPLQGLTAQVSTDLKNLSYATFTADSAGVDAAVNNERITLKRFELKRSENSVSASGTYSVPEPGKPAPPLDVDFSINAPRLESFGVGKDGNVLGGHLGGDLGAHLAGHRDLALHQRDLPGGVDERARPRGRHVRRQRRDDLRQLQPQLGDALFGRAHGVPPR